jgi:hypothetical protein
MTEKNTWLRNNYGTLFSDMKNVFKKKRNPILKESPTWKKTNVASPQARLRSLIILTRIFYYGS